jgi:hypothetical protein
MATQPQPQPQVFLARFTSHETLAAIIRVKSKQFQGTLSLPGPETSVEQSFAIEPGSQIDLEVTAEIGASAVAVSTLLKNVDGIDIVQSSATNVSGFVRHPLGVDGQCTVRCPLTNESRTGRGACIECSDGEISLRICC